MLWQILWRILWIKEEALCHISSPPPPNTTTICGKLLFEALPFPWKAAIHLYSGPRANKSASMSSSTILVHVWRGCPTGLFKPLGGWKSLLARLWYGLGHLRRAQCIQTAKASLLESSQIIVHRAAVYFRVGDMPSITSFWKASDFRPQILGMHPGHLGRRTEYMP